MKIIDLQRSQIRNPTASIVINYVQCNADSFPFQRTIEVQWILVIIIEATHFPTVFVNCMITYLLM